LRILEEYPRHANHRVEHHSFDKSVLASFPFVQIDIKSPLLGDRDKWRPTLNTIALLTQSGNNCTPLFLDKSDIHILVHSCGGATLTIVGEAPNDAVLCIEAIEMTADLLEEFDVFYGFVLYERRNSLKAP